MRKKIAALMERYQTSDEQEAISRFEQEELIKTNEIDKIEANVPRPRFTDHPPMAPDDQLRSKQLQIQGVPVIASIFDRPPTIDIGLSFDLRNVPRRYYKYLPLLPRCLDSLGLRRAGEVVSYPDLGSRIQKEVFALSIAYEINPVSKRADLTIRASAADIGEFRRALALIRDILEFNNLDSSNADRLRDIVARRVSTDDLYAKQDVSTLNAAYSFHYQNDPLFLSLNSRFTAAHWDHRLKWLLHAPVDPQEIDRLATFAKDFLSTSSTLSGHDLSQKIDAFNAKGLEAELIEYWKSSFSSFPESELSNGLRQLAVEVDEDLRIGPAKTIEDLKRLQKIVLNRSTLHLDLTLRESSLGEVGGSVADLLKFIPALPIAEEPTLSDRDYPRLPIVARVEKRHAMSQEQPPSYIGFVNPDHTGGDAIFYADFPSYSQTDRKSLNQVLASKLFSGGGPHSFYMKGSAGGLAYSNFIKSDPAFRLTWYYAYRSPDIASLVRLVNSTASEASELHDPSLVDYALSQTFSFSRSAATFSERGRAAAQDIRDGNEPEKIRRFSDAILSLRKDPDLLPEITQSGFTAICGVLLSDDCKEQHQTDKSLFFFVGSEQVLSDVEKRLAIPNLVKLYPSDFWLDFPDDLGHTDRTAAKIDRRRK